MKGQSYARLTLLDLTGKIDKNGMPYYLCLCSCGTYKELHAGSIKRGDTKSCGCLAVENNKKQGKLTFKLPVGEAALNTLYKSYIRRSKQRDLLFELTKEQFKKITSSCCYYCNRPPKSNIKTITRRLNGDYFYNGIDRVNNTLGYTIQNSVPCCKTCNIAKRNLTIDEFKSWVTDLIAFSPNWK